MLEVGSLQVVIKLHNRRTRQLVTDSDDVTLEL
jgi:hypothetical protein